MKQSRHLYLAIAAFVLLDLGTLAFSFMISHEVAKDAVAINLAGRQRMLSQRTTKASLLAISPNRPAERQEMDHQEASRAYRILNSTLTAFAAGGEALGGDGTTVTLAPVSGDARHFVAHARELLAAWPEVPAPGHELERFTAFMVDNNEDVLSHMNQLTSALERQSVQAVTYLRIAQSLAFALSLINFFFIIHSILKAQRQAMAEAMTDALTQIANRAGLYRSLERCLNERQHDGLPLGVMLLDLNGFKAVNDALGHHTGDRILVDAGAVLSRFQARGWTCGRLGGDEFAVICPGLDEKAMERAAQEVDTALANLGQGYVPDEQQVSASVGWANALAGSTTDNLFAAANGMMYARKALYKLKRGEIAGQVRTHVRSHAR